MPEMSRIDPLNTAVFIIGITIAIAVWTLAIREAIDIATERPAPCFAMTASDCAALAEGGW